MSPSASQTFLFADLAGFTALTEAHGDKRAADLVDDFVRQARAVRRWLSWPRRPRRRANAKALGP